MTTVTDANRMARALRTALQEHGTEISHSESLELVASQFGHRDWNTAAARLESVSTMGPGIPVLRIMSEDQAREFYLEFLGFRVDWEHRFEPGTPLYFSVSRSGFTLHLSEHFGDGSPVSAVWIPVSDLGALHGELFAKNYRNARPGIDPDSPGGPTMSITDPFGNMLRFCQPE